MQDMSLIDKQKQLFLRRKHKLFKSLAQPSHPHPNISNTIQKDVLNLYQMVLNKENRISQIQYFIKHELQNDLTHHIVAIMDLLWSLLNVRSGTFISYVAYRLCRKYPLSYWVVNNFIQLKITGKQEKSVQQVTFLTELFFYGFSITLQHFIFHLFPQYQKHILQLLPKYIHILQSNDFFSNKSQKVFLDSFQLWMDLYKKKIQDTHLQLLSKSQQIQQRLIMQNENEWQELNYINMLQQYQTQLYKFQNAMHFLNPQYSSEELKLKSIFSLKKQCQTFKHSFQFSEYEKLLYLSSCSLSQLKPLKKSQMIRIEQNYAFVTKIKHCSTIDQCLDLSGYFLQQMNIQHNREELVQIIINDCYNYNNISYILKILLQINRFQSNLSQYCCNKGRKICGQSRMNIKYQKLLCEMSRFNLLDQNILLDYSQKILLLQNNQVTKEVESILEQLGTIVYYRSLRTHTRINAIFEKIQTMMKNKLVHFNIEQIFHLKGLLNYLRNHSNKISTAQTNEIAELEIKTNFEFILKKMQKLLKENEEKKVIEFITAGIDQQDFLNSYYYASLLRDLKQKQINRVIHQHTLSSIVSSLSQLNAQRSVCWGRFLGELYNYQVINRKKLVDNLNSILTTNQSASILNSCLKSICATLQTAKFDLKQSEQNRERKEVIYFLLELQKIIIGNEDLQKILYDQISQIMQFFHPFLTSLTSLLQIERLLTLSNQPYAKYNMYNLLDIMQSGVPIEELENGQRVETRKKYQERDKEKNAYERKWVQKPIKYKQKVEQVSQQIYEPQSPSKQSTVAEQVQVVVQKKKMKVTGRSKGDKKIKTITCSYTDQIREP